MPLVRCACVYSLLPCRLRFCGSPVDVGNLRKQCCSVIRTQHPWEDSRQSQTCTNKIACRLSISRRCAGCAGGSCGGSGGRCTIMAGAPLLTARQYYLTHCSAVSRSARLSGSRRKSWTRGERSSARSRHDQPALKPSAPAPTRAEHSSKSSAACALWCSTSAVCAPTSARHPGQSGRGAISGRWSCPPR